MAEDEGGLRICHVVLALALNAASYYVSDQLVLQMHGAREVSLDEGPRLQLVQELA